MQQKSLSAEIYESSLLDLTETLIQIFASTYVLKRAKNRDLQ